MMTLRRACILAIAVVGVVVLPPAAPATAASWQAKLLAADRANSDFFGETVAMSGDTLVVGAKYQDAGGFDRGAAYVFVTTAAGWVQQAKLIASDGANSDHFGSAVSISGDNVVVGAPMDDDAGASSGSAYVFTRAGGVWTERTKLVAPDGVLGDEFGSAVAVSGDTALIGVRRDDDKAPEAGSAYVFRNVDGVWVQEAKLLATDGQSGDLLGHSLSLSGDTALISAYGDDDRGTDAGAAYFFTRDAGGWAQRAKTVAPDGAASDLFGYSVSLSPDTALISAFADDDGAKDAGSAYVLRRGDGGWEHEAKLHASDPGEGDVFGRAVAIDGNAAVIGASSDDTLGRDAGAGYVFERRDGRWVQTAKLTAPDAAEADLLGYGVAIEGETGAVGAPLDDDRANATGSVHIFTGLADTAPPVITAQVDPAPNEAGWHNEVPVEVVFACTDAGSGIASCTPAVSLSAEPGATVTGRAVDQVGLTASVEVRVRIDTSAPTLTVDDPSPVPGAPFPASAITGTGKDALSGIRAITVTFTNVLTASQDTRIATVDGETWRVSAEGLPPGPTSASVTATDVAGNVAPPKTLLFVAQP